MQIAYLLIFFIQFLQGPEQRNISLKIDLSELRVQDKKLDTIRVNGIEVRVTESEKDIFVVPENFLISDSIAVSFSLNNRTYVTSTISTVDPLYPGCTSNKLSFISRSGKVWLHSMKCGSLITMYSISVYNNKTKIFLPKESSTVQFKTRQ